MVKRLAFLIYGCLASFLFLGTFLYAIALVGGFGAPTRLPTMTVAHLLFALVTTAYIVIAIQFEEHDLAAEHGASYEAYRLTVPMIVPGRMARTAPTAVRHSAGVLLLVALASVAATAQERFGPHTPDVPAGLDVPPGHVPFLVTHAAGTQNYVCQSTSAGIGWRLFGPQATLFRDAGSAPGQQVATHFLSGNPEEGGLGRPTWQHSIDTSRVWGRAIASSTDPTFVRFDAIPWLLVEVLGAARGTAGAGVLSRTTYIQRIDTEGGLADPATCDATRIGATVLVPYETDYVFYRAAHLR